jgi:hypothetical protein
MRLIHAPQHRSRLLDHAQTPSNGYGFDLRIRLEAIQDVGRQFDRQHSSVDLRPNGYPGWNVARLLDLDDRLDDIRLAQGRLPGDIPLNLPKP